MSSLERLLDVRKRAKAKKHIFRRQDWHLRRKYGEAWRRPTGQQSKMRLKVAGRGALVTPGFRGPREVRGLSADGKKVVHIATMKELQLIDGKKQTIIVRASVGNRNRVEILKAAMKSNVSVYNIKNPAERVKKIEDNFKQRKVRKKKVETKEEKKEKFTEEKKTDSDEKDEKEQQRREAEKVMIQK